MSGATMDCRPRCRSKRHALQLITAVTRGSTRQTLLYLRRCHNACTVTDAFGRTVLHMAASRGRWQVLQWLLDECRTDLNGKDLESGWTALHRAAFYGQIHCARILIEHGANMHSRDKEGLTPLDLTMKDRLPHVEFSHTGVTEVFTWGDNTNSTLGHDKIQARRQPEVVDYFRKHHIGIKQVAMSKYHTVFLGQDGKVYTCGHGRGGRLGHGNEQTILTPLLVEAVVGEECVHVSAARDHTILTMANGSLYSCGLNDSHQLGQYPISENSLVPKQMNHKVFKGKTIEGVCAQRFHTVIYTMDAIYTFGLNAGQLGHLKVAGEQYVTQPRQVAALNHKDVRMKLVTSSDAAVVVVTTKGDVYALHEYQCRKVVSKWLDVVQVGVSGGCLDHNSDLDTLREKGGNELTIVLLNSAGKAFLWRSSDPVLRRCIWGVRRPLRLLQVSVSTQNMAFVTADGEAFTATIPRRHRLTSTSKGEPSPAPADTFTLTLSDLVDKEEVEDVRIARLPLVHRATSIVVDRKGTNFSVLQAQPNARSEMEVHFKTLLDEANTFDSIHDIILQVDNERMAAHRYILAARSEHFRQLLTTKREDATTPGETSVVPVEGATPGLVRQMLAYIYTDTCDLLTVGAAYRVEGTEENGSPGRTVSGVNGTNINNNNSGEKGHRKKGSEGKESGTGGEQPGRKNPVKLLHELAKRYGVRNLAKRLDAVKYVNGRIVAVHGRVLPTPRVRFERKKLGQLYDVCIRGEDGHAIQCHKCVLVARLEYFHSMLASGWIETSTAETLTLPVPSDILHVILDFLYTDDAPKVKACEDVEYLCNLLVVADQLLINRLKDMVQVAIANLLSLRNVCEVLEFASVYNAVQLKATCQQLICLNLAALFEIRALDVLSADVLDELTEYYRNMVDSMSRRVVTPYDDSPRTDYLEALEQAELEEPATAAIHIPREPAGEHVSKKGRTRRKRTRTKSSGEDLDCKGQRGTEAATDKDHVTELEEAHPSPEPTATSELEPPKHITVVKRDLTCKPLAASWELRVAPPTEVREPPPPVARQVALTSARSFAKSASHHLQVQAAHGPSHVTLPTGTGSVTSEDTAGTLPGVCLLSLRGIMAEQDAAITQHKPKAPGSGKKISKLSQKERKRMASVQSPTPEKDVQTNAVPTTPTSPWSWGGVNNVVTSFKDLMMDAEKQTPSPMDALMANTSPQSVRTGASSLPGMRTAGPGGDSTTLTQGTVLWRAAPASTMLFAKKATSPQPTETGDKNPWQKRQRPPPAQRTVSFSEIISDELEQKATLSKLTNKPLHLIQIEEQAIQELLSAYQAANTWEEYITVTREYSHAQLATPTWAATQ